ALLDITNVVEHLSLAHFIVDLPVDLHGLPERGDSVRVTSDVPEPDPAVAKHLRFAVTVAGNALKRERFLIVRKCVLIASRAPMDQAKSVQAVGRATLIAERSEESQCFPAVLERIFEVASAYSRQAQVRMSMGLAPQVARATPGR